MSTESGGLAQHVTATAGFAYGVVGADIHIFGDGTPMYVLENWRVATTADPAWLLELPSRMLNARFAVVDFTGRHNELAELRYWRREAPRLAARWLHGPGGTGKTRLAAEFAVESAAAGWKVITATHGPGTVLPPPGSQDLRVDGAVGLLMIVDYADRWPHSHLTWLFSNALLHQIEVPVRILLLGRTADAWPRLRGALANQQAGTSSQEVAPLPDGDSHRLEMFTAARNSFARGYRIGDPTEVELPDALDDPEMGLTLALHMAALVAVDGHVTGHRPPRDMAGLTIYLLDREHQHWANLYGDPTHNIDPQTGYRTPPEVMNQAVFTAALTGSLAHQVGAAALRRVRLPADPEQVLIDHAVCYPSATDVPDVVLEPLYPDRLAEDFLALTMLGHAADYPAQPWAADTATALLTDGRDCSANAQAAAGYLARSITVLAATTDRWPHVGRTCLYPLLRRDPQLAVTAGSGALNALAAVREVDLAVLEAVDAVLPPGRHVDLDAGAADITARLLPHRLAVATNPAAHTLLLGTHGLRLANAGRYDEAAAVAEDVAGRYRRLAEANPATYLPDLAMALSNLGIRLSEVGRREDALVPAEEAVTIRRRLAEANPTAHLPELAVSVNNFGGFLAKVGRREEGLVLAEEAVTIRRRLAEANPAAHLSNLAASVTNLGNILSEVGRREEAAGLTQEAVAIRRRLAAANPAVHLPELAKSLTNLCTSQIEIGKRDEALEAAEEAVRLYRRLTEANPAAYLPELAASLTNLSASLSETGRQEEALGPSDEAVAIRRRLAKANPAAYLPDLGISLISFGISLAEVGQREDALGPIKDAASLFRRLAEANPAAYLPDLAMSLTNLSISLSEVGRREEALDTVEETLAIRRRLTEANPAAHLPSLAESLNNIGIRLSSLGREAEALAAVEEAVAIRRQLAQANPSAHLPDLAMSLNNLCVRLSEAGRREEALAAVEEALAIRRRLVWANQAAYLPDLAASLTNFSNSLSEVGRRDEALGSAEEANGLFRRLAESNPAAYLADFAMSVVNLSASLSEVERRDEALDFAEEATDLYRRLAQANPAVHLPDLATLLSEYAEMCGRSRLRLPQALIAAKEAVALFEGLAKRSPAEFASQLRSANQVLADVLDGFGRLDEPASLNRPIHHQEGDARSSAIDADQPYQVT